MVAVVTSGDNLSVFLVLFYLIIHIEISSKEHLTLV